MWPHQYGSPSFTPRRELITYSVPIPDDAATRARRIQGLEAADVSRPALSPPVLQALFDERDTLIRAGAADEAP